MKLSFNKKRAENSYKTYIGDFNDKSNLSMEVKWFIDEQLVLSNYYEFPIISGSIHWVGLAHETDVKDFFDKALKLIAFG